MKTNRLQQWYVLAIPRPERPYADRRIAMIIGLYSDRMQASMVRGKYNRSALKNRSFNKYVVLSRTEAHSTYNLFTKEA